MNTALARRRLAWWMQRQGLPGMLGLAGFALALAFGLTVLLPDSARNHQLEQQLTRLLQSGQAPAAANTPLDKLAGFYESFPRGETIPDWLDKIYGIADQQKLNLELGEYALTQAKSSRLDQFRIVFPVKGSYPQIRKFISAALATAPALALDSVSLKRDKAGDGNVDARIVFLLYLEKSP